MGSKRRTQHKEALSECVLSGGMEAALSYIATLALWRVFVQDGQAEESWEGDPGYPDQTLT